MRGALNALGLSGLLGFNGSDMPTPPKAAFVSPTGKRIIFDFEDVNSSFEKKAAIFESASGDGTYVQGNGHTSGRFPMGVIFHGSGYERRAEAFLSAVLEPGTGLLFHPQYARPINVEAVGPIDRFDGFASGTNQTIFSVVFYETTGLQIGGMAALGQSFDSFIDANAADFSGSLDLGSVSKLQGFLGKAKSVAKKVKSAMKIASRSLDATTFLVDDIGDSILGGIDLLVGQPLTMAFQLQMLISEPARVNSRAAEKLKAYGDYLADVFSGDLVTVSSFGADSLNAFHLDRTVSACMLANAAKLADSATDQLNTRADYVAWAEYLQGLLDDYQTWLDLNFAELSGGLVAASRIDTGEGADLRDLISQAMSNLVAKSFSAKVEMRRELAGSRTFLDLTYELYGSVSAESQDLFLRTNDLSGDEYLSIPRGRQVVWYV